MSISQSLWDEDDCNIEQSAILLNEVVSLLPPMLETLRVYIDARWYSHQFDFDFFSRVNWGQWNEKISNLDALRDIELIYVRSPNSDHAELHWTAEREHSVTYNLRAFAARGQCRSYTSGEHDAYWVLHYRRKVMVRRRRRF
jgi:hypothetical protein